MSAGGTPLGSYSLIADATNAITLRPSSYSELMLLNDSGGLTVSITPSPSSSSGQSPIIKLTALKILTSIVDDLTSNNLILNLKSNALAQSPSYTLQFSDSNQKLLQTLTGITPTNSTLTVDASALQSTVMAAYNGNGIYVVLTDSKN